ncbi:MAG: RnfABCDGE type electron transport complex subunit D [Clostridiales bacterium]|nr:RnfABCDGE type electron transport complex subunit D [Clostridiales bacterium]
MAENKLFGFSASPHVKGKRTTKWIMANVCIALLPTTVMGIIYFGLYALLIVGLSVVSAVCAEVIYKLITKKTLSCIVKEFDFTSVVTGLLVGLSIGVNYPWYAPILGSIFAIIVVKMLFGGTGKNLVNPAIAGRIFIFISFQTVVGGWVLPMSGDVITGATTLGGLYSGSDVSTINLLNLLLGNNLAGCIGETCKIALLCGAIYLAILKIIDIRLPLIYVAVTGLTTVCLYGFNFAYFLPSILSGGLILGAFFMATDYVTTPNTFIGNLIYFTALGIVTAVLRFATHMETVSFAILLLNLFVPLIDKHVINRPFGYKKPIKGDK